MIMKWRNIPRPFIIILLIETILIFPISAHKLTSAKSLHKKSEYAFVSCAQDCGMFRTLASLIGLLHLYENGYYSGLKVDFELNGLYYDPNHGPNWWEYYFEPISIGDQADAIPLFHENGPPGIDCAMLTEFSLYRTQVFDLINKYIQLKPHIQNKINQYTDSHFQDDIIIGVHYRGTDKSIEAPRVSYETMTSLIREQEKIFWPRKLKVFIATDEQKFLDYMKTVFPSRILFYEEAMHSSNNIPVHMTVGQNYKKGEDAIIDCLLLSKCNLLIKTSSNLSLFSMYFNPKVPVIHASQRPWHAPLE